MAYNADNKESLGQKFRKFTLKAAFCAAVMSPVSAVAEDVYVPSSVVEDRATPEACAATANLREVTEKTPQISRDIAIMAQLTLTGVPIDNILKDSENKIKTCLFPVPEGSASLYNYYANGVLSIARTSGTSAFLHEGFHAVQDAHKAIELILRLTIRDAIVGGLLHEASAAAYELTARQEAENKGLKLFGDLQNMKSHADMPGIKAVFDKAYAAELQQHPSAEAEAKALEAGGKAAVKYLLDGNDPHWSKGYGDLTIKNINNNGHMFSKDGRENRPGYAAQRRDAYNKMGAVSPDISFIPDEYLGENATQHINRALEKIGISITKKTSAITPAPSGRGLG